MSANFLAIDTELMWTVTLAGIVIVFAVLLLLVGLFYLFGRVMRQPDQKNGRSNVTKTSAKANSASKPKFAPKQPSAAPVIEQGIPQEVVAAIAAAVAQLDSGVIRSIQKQRPRSTRPVWAMAGISENTRPF